MPSVKSPKSEILPGIIRSDSGSYSYRPRSTTTSYRIIGTTSSSSMTNGHSLRLRLLLLSNIFGLLSRTQALPFEYLDEHDDFNYDLDTAQSQAKYDARLLSQQMLSDTELRQQAGATGLESESTLDPHTLRAQGGRSDGSVEDLEPHSRAAACFTNGHKYTHGQKVPRQDACEVCLCMDGEIFCWWERCDKTNANKVKEMAAGNDKDNDNDNGIGNGKVKANGGGVISGVGFGFGFGGGGGDGAAAGVGDYSDPYRYESTTRKSTKVHKTAGKVGKRRKHRRNQKNFNDYEVFQSHKQQQPQQQPQDYKKSAIKQQQQQQKYEHQIQKQKTGDATNYNIIKQHKHEQHQKLPEKEQQQEQEQEQEQSAVAPPVNQAAAKKTHYQQPATTIATPSHQQEQQQQHSSHPHKPPHSSSKILNFPENLPALLYYDYKTEEHEHHQHQHHQQHLLHEKQRLQHQQEALARQKPPADAGVELHTDLGVDKNFDDAETDSDILPEPPTKRPKAAPTQWTTSSSPRSSMAKALMTNQAATSTTASTTTTTTTTTTMRTTTTTGTNGNATGRLSSRDSGRAEAEAGDGATVAATNLQPDRSGGKDLDDAFHRWLTSTELNADSTNTPDDASGQETAASTIIDDVAIRNKSDSGSGNGRSGSSSSSSSSSSKDNVADAVFFRSSYNDYSSEFNGSVVNIDITLTAVDVHPRRQTDLIANGNRTSGVSTEATPGIAETPGTTAGATMDPQATDRRSSVTIASTTRPPTSISNNNSNNQDQPQATGSPAVPPYTLTTIITTVPLAPGRMCNVLGKLYKIGDILPQDTGNCLQCICTDAVTPDEMPSVTCSPHNCPPLVLPDLFDATGY
ncbi:myb-like protein Q [Drosophila pseudoobscura]|uniref:Myb-like protein Q n=1 Tax=Drosophila pseudoobscura pseudoobscura TaxID=46245 RepID=A0A6I8VSP3_DROPS|nr:myb-like protein Q [Drosophila pseudoobscura]XP_033234071.1 myb-like protein Q [Drosophila pseudoobscura]XP_033234072.1 myb-like protein Q [Drosophila pseudoobscura]XP_033234073.1 myb-like protein Q [Drosophila pseudoobscura]